MADVQKIIRSLTTIATAQYAGQVGARPTLHQQAFNRLQGSARQVAAILTQNPAPGRDQIENLKSQFAAMQTMVNDYCAQTAGTEAVLKAFHEASVEWALLQAGR
jgi:hypothetical protein